MAGCHCITGGETAQGLSRRRGGPRARTGGMTGAGNPAAGIEWYSSTPENTYHHHETAEDDRL